MLTGNLLGHFRLRLFFLIMFLLGMGLWGYSLSMEYYTDAEKMSEIEINVDLENPDYRQQYWKAREELETNKRRYMDLGSGVAIASGVLWLVCLVGRVREIRDLHRIRSLDPKVLVGVTYCVWLSGIFWIFAEMVFRAYRNDFPWFADAIIIPIVEISVFIVIGCLPLAVLFAVSLPGSRHPVPIFIRTGKWTLRRIFWELFFDVQFLIAFFLTLLIIETGFHGVIPIFLFLDYLLLALRAGKLAGLRHLSKIQNHQNNSPSAEPLSDSANE